jgi:hypothetical protein
VPLVKKAIEIFSMAFFFPGLCLPLFSDYCGGISQDCVVAGVAAAKGAV